MAYSISFFGARSCATHHKLLGPKCEPGEEAVGQLNTAGGIGRHGGGGGGTYRTTNSRFLITRELDFRQLRNLGNVFPSGISFHTSTKKTTVAMLAQASLAQVAITVRTVSRNRCSCVPPRDTPRCLALLPDILFAGYFFVGPVACFGLFFLLGLLITTVGSFQIFASYYCWFFPDRWFLAVRLCGDQSV